MLCRPTLGFPGLKVDSVKGTVRSSGASPVLENASLARAGFLGNACDRLRPLATLSDPT